MSSTIKLGRDLTSLSSQLESLQSQLNTSRDSINSYASSANDSTSRNSYDTYVSKYNTEKTNFDNLLADYEDIGGQYNTTLDKYNTLTFSNQSEVITYEIPNAKDQMQWLAGGTFYNEKNPGGYLWSATNPLSSDEKPTNDLGLVINRGSIHPYLNEGFTEIQNIIRGFGFLDLLGDYTESKTTTYEVTVTVTSSDGSISIDTKYVDGGEGSELASYSIGQSNMGVDAIASMLSSPHMDLMSLNAIGVVQFTITNTLNGKLFSSGKIELGNIIGASLYNTAKNVFSQQLTMGIVNALGITNVVAAGLLSIGVGALVSEFLEMAMGTDVSFGFGGEFNSKASQKLGKSAFGESKGFFGLSTVGNNLSYSLGLTDELFSGLTDSEGNTIGSSYTAEGGINMNDISGYGINFGAAYNDFLDNVTKDFAQNYGLPSYDNGYEDFSDIDERMEEINNALDALDDYVDSNDEYGEGLGEYGGTDGEPGDAGGNDSDTSGTGDTSAGDGHGE